MKNGRLTLDGTTMDYISFGRGETPLVMIPGLGDGLKNVRGMAIPMSLLYRQFGRAYKVYMFSRKNRLSPGYSTRDMAADVRTAMDRLGIDKAHVLGISQGGMIAQHFAVDNPERLEKLVLVVTASRPNETLRATAENWMELARRDDYRGLMLDNVRTMYTHGYVRKNRWLLPLTGKFGKPESYEKFLIMAEACLHHDCYRRLPEIRAKTLVVGGERDVVLTGEASREIAAQIPGSRLVMYPQYGHGLYQEAPEFDGAVLDFLRET